MVCGALPEPNRAADGPEGRSRTQATGWIAAECRFAAGIISAVGIAAPWAGLGEPACASSAALLCRDHRTSSAAGRTQWTRFDLSGRFRAAQAAADATYAFCGHGRSGESCKHGAGPVESSSAQGRSRLRLGLALRVRARPGCAGCGRAYVTRWVAWRRLSALRVVPGKRWMDRDCGPGTAFCRAAARRIESQES